jgi:Fic family protein
MDRDLQGELRLQSMNSPEPYSAFIPAPLPPSPDLVLDTTLSRMLSKADLMLGRLDGIGRVLPDANLFIYFYSRKEAVLSSQIEGTQSTLADFLLFEAEQSGTPNNLDITEVSNYVAAMKHGLKRLQSDFPLSLRLLREMHEILLKTGRGSEQTPGEFRRSQNWIGGSRPGNAIYVPPPVVEINKCLDAFEKFLHVGALDFPPLIQAALLHLQFESIHPFLDGNGRLGRLLISLLLIERQVLSQPLLYPSLFLKQNRNRYYQLLQEVRSRGNWEDWVLFFLEAVAVTAEQAVQLANAILKLFEKDEASLTKFGRRRASVQHALKAFQLSPLMMPSMVVKRTGLSQPTVDKTLEELRQLGILEEISGRSRGRVYQYAKYIQLLNEGTEL